MDSIGVLWAQFGPYHYARLSALKRLAGAVKVHGLELADLTRDYPWERSGEPLSITTVFPKRHAERLPFATVFTRVRRHLRRLGVQVCLLPSYSPRQSLAALLAARSLGISAVMMNESHAGTARATGFGAIAKRRLIKLFSAALVGGGPQRRYFASMGLQEHQIFQGYDAIDNDYFSRAAGRIRSRASEVRSQFGLPRHYFLSLGRFVGKKNLTTLIRAYRLFLDFRPDTRTHLVLVGSGEEELKLRSISLEYGLVVYDKQGFGRTELATRRPRVTEQAGVHFYGVRQIDENPVFYALADAFVLPSLSEEWGLVVNEAMASGLPVIVSETAGCAEDLLPGSISDADLTAQLLSRVQRLGLVERIRKNGLVFDPRSSDELSRIFLFLEAFPEKRSAMGQASGRIVDKFSCENFAKNSLLAAEAALSLNRLQARP